MTDANTVLFALLGGTALLLYGVRLVGEGLQRAAGTDDLGTFPIAADFHFRGGTITLPDGTSTVLARLLEGTSEIATASAAVVVDRTPPALSITRPRQN